MHEIKISICHDSILNFMIAILFVSRVAGAERKKINFNAPSDTRKDAYVAASRSTHYLNLLPRGSFRLHLLVCLSARLPGRSKKEKQKQGGKTTYRIL